jgi:hypothetical protein
MSSRLANSGNNRASLGEKIVWAPGAVLPATAIRDVRTLQGPRGLYNLLFGVR